jgi:hypothetical protein
LYAKSGTQRERIPLLVAVKRVARLVLKDIMLLAGGLLIMADSARAFLEARPYAKLQTMTTSKTSIAPAE